eukprot:gene24314-13868_t
MEAFTTYGFGGLKLDGCSEFRDTHRWFNLSQTVVEPLAGSVGPTSRPRHRHVMVEDCHNMGGPKVLDNQTGELDCPMHIYRTGNDITPGSWESFLTNLEQLVPFLHHTPVLSKPGCW